MGSKNILFLLGGMDLEMVTIRNLLEQYKVDFQYLGLGWSNAALSAYSDILWSGERTYEEIIGIELRQDIDPPVNYRIIDHHNGLPPRPTALEQVAELIGADISDRYHQLVIANDVGHVAAMRAMCASDEEIRQIREKDRGAQGVTEAEEKQAELDAKSVKKEGDVWVAKTTLHRFSPITDRLNLPCFLVHNDETLNYYGRGARDILESWFKDEYGEDSGLFYAGGEGEGFFGLTEKATEIKPISEWKNQIVAMIKPETIVYSTHAFMLPLKWDFIGNKLSAPNNRESIPFDDRTKLKDFDKLITQCGWVRNPFEITLAQDYNELTYFHDHVQRVIFDIRHADENEEHPLGKDRVMAHYNLKSGSGGTYSIFSDQIAAGSYDLAVHSIGMHVFSTGVLIVTYNLENRSYVDRNDILMINEFGRRIYPQFLTGDEDLTMAVKSAFLPSRIELRLCDGILISENFSAYCNLSNVKTSSGKGGGFRYNAVIHPPAHLYKLLKDEYGSTDFVFNDDEEKERENIIRLSRVTDDRMFFQCWFGDNILAACLGEENSSEFAFAKSKWWYAFIFGDKGGPSIANPAKMKNDLLACTYARWVGHGTLYGFTRDSMVAISSDSKTLAKYDAPDQRVHAQTMYYQLAVLSLAQRASVLKFSAEVSHLADLARNDDADSVKRIKALYLNYIEFINKMHFREVTSQLQGTEMYKMMQEQMEIARDVKDLDTEIEELHRFANLLVQEKDAKQAKSLTVVATIFLPSALIAGILGMNIFERVNLDHFGTCDPMSWFWIAIVLTPMVVSISYMLYANVSRKTKSNRQ